VVLGVGTAMADFIPPAVGVFRPSADWTGALGGGVGKLALGLWYLGCKHSYSPVVGCFLWGSHRTGVPTSLWILAKARKPPKPLHAYHLWLGLWNLMSFVLTGRSPI
jgi:hypothetical protein